VVTFHKNGYKEVVARSLTLSKKQRLVKNSEFRAVLDQRKRCNDQLLVVHVAANGLAFSRIGVSIGRAQGNAVVRNRIKRLTREVFRLNQFGVPCGFDILVTMAKRRHRGSMHGVLPAASVKISSCPLVAINDSLLKLVGLCHKKLLNS
jgi:ribonuclease P protein component